jgi:hypothetical protein
MTGRTLAAGAGVLVGMLIGQSSGLSARQAGDRTLPLAVPPADAGALLQSSNAREQAWGAWIAGRDLKRETIPSLQQLIASRLGTSSVPDIYVLDVAVDALIQMRAAVQPEVAMWLYDRRQAQALILLSMAGSAADSALLRIAAAEEGLPWFVAANVLVTRRAAGLGALLLSDLEITVVVLESGGGGFIGGSSSGVGDGGSGLAAGFPPIAHYRLSTASRPGSVVVANGPRTVYYERTLSEPGRGPAASTLRIGGPTSDERLAYIAALLGTDRSQLPVRAQESRNAPARGTAGHQAAVDEIRNDFERRSEALVRLMVERGALTEAEAATVTAPRVNVVIR